MYFVYLCVLTFEFVNINFTKHYIYIYIRLRAPKIGFNLKSSFLMRSYIYTHMRTQTLIVVHLILNDRHFDLCMGGMCVCAYMLSCLHGNYTPGCIPDEFRIYSQSTRIPRRHILFINITSSFACGQAEAERRGGGEGV